MVLVGITLQLSSKNFLKNSIPSIALISFLKQLLSKPEEGSETDVYLLELLGFRPTDLSYYHQALTHKSVSSSKKKSNERLEFLGDGVLDVIVSEHLYKKYPNYSEGRLSKVKSVIVNRKHLNKLAKRIDIDKVLKSELNSESDSVYGNALEALIGAVYLDQGYEVAKEFVNGLLKENVNIKRLERFYRNYKGELLEWCQKHKQTIEYKLADEQLVDGQKQFKVELFIDEKLVSNAEHSSKKIAEKIAAEKAFNSIFIKS